MDKLTPEIFERCQNSILKIVGFHSNGKYKGHGSAVVIKSKGVVITNYHNIIGSSYFELYQGDNKIEYERIVALSKKNDLLILKLKDYKDFPILETSDSTFIGETVHVFGNPLQYDNSYINGQITGKNRIIPDTEHPIGIRMENLLQISAPLSPGNSGGGLFNTEGKLIGITICADLRGQSINFAIPVEDVIKIIKQAPKKAIYQNKILEMEVIKFHLTSINGDYKQALIHVNNCLRLSKGAKYFLHNKIELLFRLNQYKDVIKICKKAIKNNTDDDTILTQLNSALISLGEVKESLNVALMLYKKHPKDYETCNNVGMRYVDMSQYDKAVIFFNKAKKINRKGFDHLTGLARMYILQTRFIESEEILQRIIKQNPKEYYAIYLLSELNYHTKNYVKALDYLNEYLKEVKYPTPENFEIDLKKEIYYPSSYEEYMGLVVRMDISASMFDYKIALNGVNNLLRLYPNESYLYISRARTLLMMNETEKALENLLKSIKINPNNTRAYNDLADIYFKLNKLKKAFSYIKKALKITPNFIPSLIIKARLLFKRKRYDETIMVCRKILKFNSKHLEALDFLRICYYEKKKYNVSLVYAKRQLEVMPNEWSYLLNVGRILLTIGYLNEALDYADKSVEKSPNFQTYMLRGEIHFENSNYYDAIKDFTEAEKFDKSNYELYSFRGMSYNFLDMYNLALNDFEKTSVLGHSSEYGFSEAISELRKKNSSTHFEP